MIYTLVNTTPNCPYRTLCSSTSYDKIIDVATAIIEYKFPKDRVDLINRAISAYDEIRDYITNVSPDSKIVAVEDVRSILYQMPVSLLNCLILNEFNLGIEQYVDTESSSKWDIT